VTRDDSNRLLFAPRWLMPLALIAGATLSGCGGGRPARVEVSGQVLIDGKALPKAFVKFVPADGRPSTGQTDADGRFTLTCYDPNDGVKVGTHKVAVIAIEEINGNTVRWWAPKRYADHRTSGLEYEINKPLHDLKIEISWEGGKPFFEGPGR
jgi:hypothetical protein